MRQDSISVVRFWQRVSHEMRLTISRMSSRKDCRLCASFLCVFVLALATQAVAARTVIPATSSQGGSLELQSLASARNLNRPPKSTFQAASGSSLLAQRTSMDQTSVPMLVKRCSMTVSVADVSSAMRTATGIATRFGGHVQSSNAQYENGSRYGEIVLLAPVERFDELRTELTGQFPKLLSEMTSIEDVSIRYVDASARAQSLQATYDQLTKLMQTAKQVSEVVDVQQLLRSVAADLESQKATAKELSTRAAVVHIRMTFHEPHPSDERPQGQWRPIDTIKAAIRIWARTATTAADAIIFLATLLLPAFVIYVGVSNCRAVTGSSRSGSASELTT